MFCPNTTHFKNRKTHSFTLVEVLIAIGVLGTFLAAVIVILQIVLQNIGQSRVRSTALSLAQSRMELIRNLPYNQVGTVGGIPNGAVSPEEIITINSLPFTISTSVIFIDDPYDGVSPQDTKPTDYKRIRVQVAWAGIYPSVKPITFITNISPRGLESNVAGGTLFIQVFNANGQPVSNAQITIDNTTVNPPIHTQTLTDSSGTLNLPGSPVCVACYKVSVTKAGYSTDRTYSNAEVVNPNQPYATVIDGRITQLSFAIDEVSGITIKSYGSRSAGFPMIANVMFTLHGSKIIGTDTSDNPVYKYSYSTNTGGGIVSIPNLEWDTYKLDLSGSYFDLAGSNPLNPFALAPKTNLTVSISAVPKTSTSLLVAIKNVAGQLQSSASAELTDMLSYSASYSAGASGSADFGQAFFGSLTPGIFNLKVTSDGYQEASASLNLTKTHMETVILEPIQ